MKHYVEYVSLYCTFVVWPMRTCDAQYNHVYCWCVCLPWDIIISTGRRILPLLRSHTIAVKFNVLLSFLQRFSQIIEQMC